MRNPAPKSKRAAPEGPLSRFFVILYFYLPREQRITDTMTAVPVATRINGQGKVDEWNRRSNDRINSIKTAIRKIWWYFKVRIAHMPESKSPFVWLE